MIADDLVYDVGMHNGDDTEYYLEKGYRVVAIDANPSQCELCRERFKADIADGRLVILNIGVGQRREFRKFQINLRESQISTFSDRLDVHDAWEAIEMEVVPLSELVLQYGRPDYVKIDVEHYDHLVLRDLCNNGIRPRYISAEAHSRETFDALLVMGYEKFKLVVGEQVQNVYGCHDIRRRDGKMLRYFFNPRSTGPFGDDLPGEWWSADRLGREIDKVGLGWIDIHAYAPET